jgi:S1-C subfamily serine protease
VIPEPYLDAIVAIGTEDSEGNAAWVASGFLYGYPLEASRHGPRLYQVYLVTNRHVFQGMKRALLRCNPRGHRPAREYVVELEDARGRPTWLVHRERRIDVAVVPINFELLRKHAMAVSFFAADLHTAPRRRWKALGVSEGEPVIVLGFPMGLVGGKRNTVIVRSGTIARSRDTLERTSPEFLLDAFVFPGNSGGPVLVRCGSGPPLVIGLIHAYVPYQDVAVSVQTQHPRVIFEENSGLSAAHPIDYVLSVVRRHQRHLSRAARRPLSAPSRSRAPRSRRPGRGAGVPAGQPLPPGSR